MDEYLWNHRLEKIHRRYFVEKLATKLAFITNLNSNPDSVILTRV